MNTRDGQEVIQKHRSTGVTATVTIPTGQAYRSAVGWSVLTMDGTGALHVLRTADGTLTVDTPVTGFPAGARPLLYRTGGSVARLAIVYTLDGRTSVGLVDLSDGAFRTYVTGDTASPQLAFNDRRPVADRRAIRVDAGPGTEPTALTRTDAQVEAVGGDQLLLGNPMFVTGGTEAPLTARSLLTGTAGTAGTAGTVLTSSFGGIGPTLDGGALATAGPSTWTLTLTDASGKIVRTLTGRSTRAAVRPAWDGTSDSGGGTTGGAYTWRLTAHPRDGQGPDLTLSGTMTLG
ncbi:FlgD immunoglobulin-like domain containing protein [Streptomyces massasporeus]|uniref:FlgD immunoglobulin-like domain containing protein n=1 Tax=Streptomyces massasporeus TaxID=67324 RepID=UPI0033D09C92